VSKRAPATASRRSPRSAPGPSHLPLLGTGLFLAFVAAMALLAKLPLAAPALYGGLSLLTFAVYAADKAAARGGRRRVPENTLHLLALLGGWPGALLAHNRLRHKSRKASFQIVFRATVALNCCALGWLLAGGLPAWRAGLGA
jgi:uncharacterized membrane protein YsdA (DUF1294 family)